MKGGSSPRKKTTTEGLRSEYRFDYAKAKANRFVERTPRGGGEPCMSTSGSELREALAQSVSVSDDALSADLTDGRRITATLAWFRRLVHGTPGERANWRLIGGGEGIHRPDLDEDISVESLLVWCGANPDP